MTLPESQPPIGSSPQTPQPAAPAGTPEAAASTLEGPQPAAGTPRVPAARKPDGPTASAAPALPPSDADLIAATKAGQPSTGQPSTGKPDAYTTLQQRHLAAARSLAGQLVRGQAEADDVVAETFAKLRDLLRRGGGPEDAFRPHLLIAVRRTAYDRHRAERRQLAADAYGLFDSDAPFADPAMAGQERSMIARAFASLPERWQAVLWHIEVEGERPAEVAALLGLSAAGVTALAYRAREGLRQAYLQLHLSGVARAGCRPIAGKLGAHVRGGLSKRDAATAATHLDQCEECRTLVAELADIDVGLRDTVGPLVLGAAAAGYLAPGATGGGWLAGRVAWFRRAPRRQQAAVAGVAGAVVAGFAVMALAVAANTGHVPGAGLALRGTAAGTATTTPGRAQGNGQQPGPLSPQNTLSPQATLLPQTTPPKPPPGKTLPSKAASSKASPSTTSGAKTSPRTHAPSSSQQVQPPLTGPASPALALPPVMAPPVLSPHPARTTAPAARPATPATLAAEINPVGTLTTGGQGSVAFSVINHTAKSTRQVNATITLPRGVSYATAGTLGQAAMLATGPSGWTCRSTSSGAACTHGPLAAGASSTGYLPVFVADNAATGTPPVLRVDAGTAQSSARGTHGVVASPQIQTVPYPGGPGQPGAVPSSESMG